MLRTIFASAFLLCLCLSSPVLALDNQDDMSLAEKVASRQNDLAKYQALFDPSLIKPLSPNEMRAVITAGVNWLKNSQEPNGHFRYEYDPFSGTYGNDDNIVRQAGALYQLGEIIRRDKNNLYQLDETITRAVPYFQALTKPGTYGDKKFRCISDSIESPVCKVGATGLVVTGLIGFIEARPQESPRYLPLIDDYMTYILAMKKENAGFRNVFHTGTGIPDDTESSYGNGEALLALVRYGRYKGFPSQIRKEIDNALTYTRLKHSSDAALYLWAMAALKDMYQINPAKEYFDYAKADTDARMEPFPQKRTSGYNYCSYIEGVVSAYPILQKHLSSETLMKYKEEIDFWLAKSALLQMKPADLIASDLTGAKFVKAPNSKLALGGFLTAHTQPTQRIDFTQHCISSYVQTLIDINGLTF